jgi:hypothetical protein
MKSFAIVYPAALPLASTATAVASGSQRSGRRSTPARNVQVVSTSGTTTTP